MLIKKSKNGNISIEFKNAGYPLNPTIDSNDLSMADLHIHQSGCGWYYLIDTNTKKVYSLDDYEYDTLTELVEGKTVRIYPMNETDALEVYNAWSK